MKKLLILLFVVLTTFAATAQEKERTLDRSTPPDPQPNPEIKIDIPEAITLENGLKVIVVENHKLPRVSFQLFVDYPVIKEDDKVGMRSIFGSLLASGTMNTPKDAFDQQIDYIGADLFTTSRGFYATSLKKHTPKLLGLVSDMIKSPAFPQEELDRLIKQNLSSLASSKSDPNSMAGNVSDVANYGSDHPYGEVMTEKTLENINLEDIKTFYQKQFMPNISYLIVVGDITQEKAKEYANKYFGDWKEGTPPKKMDFKTPEAKGKQVYFVDKPGAVQSVVSITHTVDLKPGDPDVIKVRVLNKILGGGGFAARIMANLREDKAYTYGAYSRFSSDPLVGEFSASGSFRNEVTDSAVVELLKEITKITKGKVEDKELELAINSMTGAFARGLESPQTIAGYALNTIRYNLSADYYQNYLKTLEAVTKDDLLNVAQKYLQPENLNIVVAGNADIAEKLLPFDSDGEISYKDYYGQDKMMLKPAPEGIRAEMVLENYTLKRLGVVSVNDIEKKLKKVGYIKTVSTAFFEAYGATLIMQKHSAKPNMGATQLKIKSPMGTQIAQKDWFDGEKGGSFAMGKVSMLEGDELEARKESNFPFPQMHYANNESTEVSLLGIDEIDGKEYYKLKILNKRTGDFTYEYYDLEDDMLSMQETFAKDPDGNAVASMIKYDDYKEVKGILIPHTMKMTAQGQELKFETKEVVIKKKPKTDAFLGEFDDDSGY